MILSEMVLKNEPGARYLSSRNPCCGLEEEEGHICRRFAGLLKFSDEGKLSVVISMVTRANLT